MLFFTFGDVEHDNSERKIGDSSPFRDKNTGEGGFKLDRDRKEKCAKLFVTTQSKNDVGKSIKFWQL